MGKKLLKIDINTEKEVSFEEMVIKFDPLIKSIINQWSAYDCDEIKQICLIGLWKAFDKYDITRATTFGFFAKRVMVNEVYCYCKKNIINYSDISINDTYNDQSNENFVAYELDLDSIVTYENSLYEIFLNSYLLILPEDYTNLFKLYYLKSLTQKEIAEILGLTQPAISYQLKRLSLYIQKIYEVDRLLGQMPEKCSDLIKEIYILENIEEKFKILPMEEILSLSTLLGNIKEILYSNKDTEQIYILWIDELIERINYYISLNAITESDNNECINEVSALQLNLFDMVDSLLSDYTFMNRSIHVNNNRLSI